MIYAKVTPEHVRAAEDAMDVRKSCHYIAMTVVMPTHDICTVCQCYFSVGGSLPHKPLCSVPRVAQALANAHRDGRQAAAQVVSEPANAMTPMLSAGTIVAQPFYQPSEP